MIYDSLFSYKDWLMAAGLALMLFFNDFVLGGALFVAGLLMHFSAGA